MRKHWATLFLHPACYAVKDLSVCLNTVYHQMYAVILFDKCLIILYFCSDWTGKVTCVSNNLSISNIFLHAVVLAHSSSLLLLLLLVILKYFGSTFGFLVFWIVKQSWYGINLEVLRDSLRNHNVGPIGSVSAYCVYDKRRMTRNMYAAGR